MSTPDVLFADALALALASTPPARRVFCSAADFKAAGGRGGRAKIAARVELVSQRNMPRGVIATC